MPGDLLDLILIVLVVAFGVAGYRQGFIIGVLSFVGFIGGGAIGALIVSFIQTGIVGAGLSGFYVQFFNGLIIILSLIGHRWNQIRYR